MSDQYLGCLPRETTVGDGSFPVWGDTPDTPLIPRSEWKDVDLSHVFWMTKNQGQQSSCASTATVGAIMAAREMADLPRIELSQASIYRFVNGGRDAGSSIDGNLKQAMEVGATPCDVIDQYDWRGKNWPSDWKDTAKNFRIVEAWDCPTPDHLGSALQRGFFGMLGVRWGAGGHAIIACGWSKSQAWKIKNSWDKTWGDNGTGHLPESQVSNGAPMFGAWAVRAVSLHG